MKTAYAAAMLAGLMGMAPVPAIAASATLNPPASSAAASPLDSSYAGANLALAPADSDIDKVGQVILAAVDGRTREEALAHSSSGGDNPFDLDGDKLLLAAGVFFLSAEADGVAIAPSELSIWADDPSPDGKGQSSAATPAIIPFAFNRAGICYGGYATGFPVLNQVFAANMHGKICNAATVAGLVAAQYNQAAASSPGASTDGTATPSGGSPAAAADSTSPTAAAAPDNTLFDGVTATDRDLEMIVNAAYSAAYGRALKHGNKFNSSDFGYGDLRDAMRATLEKAGYGAAAVATDPSDGAAAAKACATDGKVDLRVAFNNDGVGVVIAAVSATRMAAYEYNPSTASDLAITHADDCRSAAAATTTSGGGGTDRLTKPAH